MPGIPRPSPAVVPASQVTAFPDAIQVWSHVASTGRHRLICYYYVSKRASRKWHEPRAQAAPRGTRLVSPSLSARGFTARFDKKRQVTPIASGSHADPVSPGDLPHEKINESRRAVP